MKAKEQILHFKERVNEFRSYRVCKICAFLALVGGTLMFLVFWPIQAERARRSSLQWNEKVASKKAELKDLQRQFQYLSSLPVLDRWAKNHGPWKSPSSHDIITISY